MKAITLEQKTVGLKFFAWLRNHGKTITETAKEFNISSQALFNWKSRGVPPSQFSKIAEIMAIPLDALVSRGEELELLTNKVRVLPIISSVHAGAWTGIGDGQYEEFMPVTVNCSRDSFCLRVHGTSMVPVFYEGDIVTVDPAIKPSAGKYVVALHGSENEATIKKYRELGVNDEGRDVFELVPENRDYASYRSDRVEISIVGVVISVSRSV